MSILDTKGRYLFAEVLDLYVYDIVDGSLKVALDELQNSDLEFTMTKTPMSGKGGVVLYNLKRAKGVKLTATSGEISDGALALQLGSDPEILENAPWPIAETLIVKGGKIRLSKKAKGDSGKELISVNIDSNPDKPLTQDVAVAPDKFTYDVATNEMTLDSTIKDGTAVFVRYDATAATVKKITDYSDVFGKPARIEAKTRWIDACSKKSFLVWVIMEQGDTDGNFTLSVGENGAVQNIAIDALGGCGRTNLIDIFIADEEDIV